MLLVMGKVLPPMFPRVRELPSGFARESDASAFREACSAQATGDLISVSKGIKVTQKAPELIGNAVGDAASPVSGDVEVDVKRCNGSNVSISGMEDISLAALHQQIQKL